MLAAYIVAALISLWIGYLAGQQPRWEAWHGPVGAVLAVPLAITIGFDTVVSILAPLCLGVGFVVSAHTRTS